MPWAGITFKLFQRVMRVVKVASTFKLRGTFLSGSMGAPTDRPDLSESIWYLIHQSLPSLREKIDANLPQRRHRPRRHLGPVASVRLAEVGAQEVRVPVLDDGRADFSHQRELVVHVVHRQSMQAHQSPVSQSVSCVLRVSLLSKE